MHSVLLTWTLSVVLPLLEFFLDSLMAAFNLLSLAFELIHLGLLLLELVDHGGLIFFEFASDSILLSQPLRNVLNTNCDSVSLLLSTKEWLGSDVSDGSLNLVSSLLCVLKLSLDVSHFLGLKLELKVLLLDSLILLIGISEVLLNLSYIIFGLFENGLAVLEVALKTLHFAFN